MINIEGLGSKSAGSLVKSEDWNTLVAAVSELQTGVSDLLNDVGNLQNDVSQIKTDVGQVKTEVESFQGRLESLEDFRDEVQPIVKEYYRVTLASQKTHYAIGEFATVIAQVTDLAGQPLDLTNAAERPWIDFMTAWGQLKPAAGFTSRGAEGRAISVRVDQQGQAEVLLRAEHVGFLNEEAEEEVSTFMRTVIPQSSKSLSATVLEAETPAQIQADRSTFPLISTEYDKGIETGFSKFIDSYYTRNLHELKIRQPIFRQRWRDNHAILVAFAKKDGNPATPDQARGVSSIQLRFRDWVHPWIIDGYLKDIDQNINRFLENPLLTREANELQFTRTMKDEVIKLTRGKGILGKQRDYNVVQGALGRISTSQPEVTEYLQDAIAMQQTLAAAEVFAVNTREEAGFSLATTISRRTDEVSSVQGKVAELERQLENVSIDVGGVKSSVGAIGGRLDATLAEGGQLQTLHARLADVTSKVEVFQSFDPTIVKSDVLGLKSDLLNLQRQIG